MAEIVTLPRRGKRLRSLDEFEPPAWASRAANRGGRSPRFSLLLGACAAAGAALGWML